MPEWLYESGPYGLLIFVLVTVALGGAAAVATGRALAQTWRPLWHVPVNMLLLAAAVRFVHFSVFEEVLLSPRSYLFDWLVLALIAWAAYAQARRGQMARQYGWLATSG